MKRLKNIEGTIKEQLDEIQYREERQLDAIEEQRKYNLEAIINYKNLFLKAGNPIIDNYNFLKKFGTFYDFSIDLLN